LPLLLDDESGVARANDWANGFMRGMEMRRDGWAGLMDDEERGGSLIPILALAHEHHPDPEMRTYKEPISAEMPLRDVWTQFSTAAVRYAVRSPINGLRLPRRLAPSIVNCTAARIYCTLRPSDDPHPGGTFGFRK
jgi:hypothetical protein